MKIEKEKLPVIFEASGTEKFAFVLAFFYSKSDILKFGLQTVGQVAESGFCWLAYPKKSSKLYIDITRDLGWEVIQEAGWSGIAIVSINDDWSAIRFIRNETIGKKTRRTTAKKAIAVTETPDLEVPEDLLIALNDNKHAEMMFTSLAPSYRKLYISWITGAKREETRVRRIQEAVKKLAAGIKDPNTKIPDNNI